LVRRVSSLPCGKRQSTFKVTWRMWVTIKADQETKMGVITDVKQALRQAKALKISYSATENGK
jgi:biopolymer transport protein ExbD